MISIWLHCNSFCSFDFAVIVFKTTMYSEMGLHLGAVDRKNSAATSSIIFGIDNISRIKCLLAHILSWQQMIICLQRVIAAAIKMRENQGTKYILG